MSGHDADPDAELIARVGRDDASAVRQLVARKLPRVLALAARMLGDRMEAQDVAQETFVRVWKQAPHWRVGEARFDTWLHRVALNLCYDRLRTRRETVDESAAVSSAASPADSQPYQALPAAGEPEAALEARQDGERVRAALAALPPRQREALVLTYYQELSNAQAASLMGLSVDALESLLVRARRGMRTQLAQEEAARGARSETSAARRTTAPRKQ
ncbi:RNA polymerase sigma factor [Trinickia diaoshuihuensis]|uniref:RNA polymerase sigma factor n=1 Tax=Trinickia diaoshuihuensis TaxID=2292265 RepID=UPI0030B84AB8